MKWRIGSPSRRQAGGPVGQVALVLLLADRHAEVRARADAVHALATLGREERHDVVAGRDVGDALADGLDDARALVPEHRRRVARRVGARGRVEVGVADAAGLEAHEHLAGLRLGQVDLRDVQRLAELLQHGGTHLHGSDTLRWTDAARGRLGAVRDARPDLVEHVGRDQDRAGGHAAAARRGRQVHARGRGAAGRRGRAAALAAHRRRARRGARPAAVRVRLRAHLLGRAVRAQRSGRGAVRRPADLRRAAGRRAAARTSR